MKKLLIEWVRTAPQKMYRDKCEKVSPGLFAKLCITASSARKKTVSSLHHCHWRRHRRRRDSRHCTAIKAAEDVQWPCNGWNTQILHYCSFRKLFHEVNGIDKKKLFIIKRYSTLITKIALKIFLNNFSQQSSHKKHHLLLFKVKYHINTSDFFYWFFCCHFLITSIRF